METIEYVPIEARAVEGIERAGALGLRGGYLYAANGRELVTFDTREYPFAPPVLSRLTIDCDSRQMAVSDKYIFLSARNFGVFVFDREDPARPAFVTRIDPIELATGIAVAGDVLFVSLRVYGVQAIDVTDPTRPRHLSLLRGCGEIQSLFPFGDGTLALGDWGGSQLRMADYQNVTAPRLVSTAKLDGFGDGVFVVGGRGYAATGHNSSRGPRDQRRGRGHGLEIFDLADPSKPARLGGIKFPVFYEVGDDFWTVRLKGSTAYVADTFNGLFVVDVSDPANPLCVGRAQLPEVERQSYFQKIRVTAPDCVKDIAVGPETVYIAGPRTGLFVVPAAEDGPAPEAVATAWRPEIRKTAPHEDIPGLTRVEVDGAVRRLAAHQSTLFAACSGDGLRALALDADGLPAPGPQTQSAWRDRRVYDVAVRGDTLFCAEGDALRAYAISGGGDGGEVELKKVGELPFKPPAMLQVLHLFRDGTVGVGSGGGGWAYFIDLSDPEKMRLIERDGASLLYGDLIADADIDGVVAINWHGRGLRWYDLKREGKFLTGNTLTGKDYPHQGSGIARLGERFLLAARNGGYYLLDPARPDEHELGQVEGEAPKGVPSTDGGARVAFSDRIGGVVRVYDAADGRFLRMTARYDLSQGTPDRVLWRGGRMYIPAWNSGILVSDIQ